MTYCTKIATANGGPHKCRNKARPGTTRCHLHTPPQTTSDTDRGVKRKRARLTKADAYEAATAPVSDIETIIDELDQVESEAPVSMQTDIGEARAYLRQAVDKLMGLEE